MKWFKITMTSLFASLLLQKEALIVTCFVTRNTLSRHQPTIRRFHRLNQNLLNNEASNNVHTKKIAIVGGGLAGLSVCYHLLLLQQQTKTHKQSLDITIYDLEEKPGLGGASSVAGGLLHPFSPRGKLVFMGIEGLDVTNSMIDAAKQQLFDDEDNFNANDVVLRSSLVRVALTENHSSQLQKTAEKYPQFATWKPVNETHDQKDTTQTHDQKDGPNNSPLGTLHLSNGCQVVHVPSYLRGLYYACRQIACTTTNNYSNNNIDAFARVNWCQISSDSDIKASEEIFNDIVYTAGSGLFIGEDIYKNTSDVDDCIDSNHTSTDEFHLFSNLPIQLVRGQSVHVPIHSTDDTTQKTSSNQHQNYDAILCGKYVSPLPPSRNTSGVLYHNDIKSRTKMLVGATHEYKDSALSREQVWNDLKEKVQPFTPFLDFDSLNEIKNNDECWTTGYRVVSQRGANGRLPILGKISKEHRNGESVHVPINQTENPTKWIFTGLSSRGLLHHGIFGKLLSESILLQKSDKQLFSNYPELSWWKKTFR